MENQILQQNVNMPLNRLADQVLAHIQCRLGGQVRNLQVLIRDDGLVLQGHTQTYYAKQLAHHTAIEVAKLRNVVNEIQVQ